MLTPEMVRNIKKVHIKSRRLVDTVMAGAYKSVFRGSGMEFQEVREYTTGDDVRSIDWKVSARMGHPYVKIYTEEREQVVMLLVDMSASGLFGTTDSLKREKAAETAAILAFNAIRNNDKVGAVLFTDRVEVYIPPKKGSAHVWRVIREIFSHMPACRKTHVGQAAKFLGKVISRRSIAFFISDFLSPEFSTDLKRAARKHEIISILLSDPKDFQLPEKGIVTVKDPETDRRITLDASDPETKSAWETAARQRQADIAARLSACNVDTVFLSTEMEPADALVRYFMLRERRRR